jgi:hypothetical protein
MGVRIVPEGAGGDLDRLAQRLGDHAAERAPDHLAGCILGPALQDAGHLRSRYSGHVTSVTRVSQ